MLDLNEDFADLLLEFSKAAVEYVVVGAHALAVAGVPRATGDLDVLVRPTAENAARVYAALRAFGAPLAVADVKQSDFTLLDCVYQMGLPPRRVDVMTSISGVTFEEAHASRVTVERNGIPIPLLGRDMLIQNKRAAARPKDLADVDALEHLPRHP